MSLLAWLKRRSLSLASAIHLWPQIHTMHEREISLFLLCRDESVGGDGWAVKQGWVSVTPLGLRSDIDVRGPSQVRYPPTL